MKLVRLKKSKVFDQKKKNERKMHANCQERNPKLEIDSRTI